MKNYSVALYELVTGRKKLLERRSEGLHQSHMELKLLNEQWGRAARFNVFWAAIREEYRIPMAFESLDAYVNQFPLIRKAEFIKHKELIDQICESSSSVTTGGSSGAPVKFPLSSRDRKIHYSVTHGYRKELASISGKTGLHCWGHSHLYGEGYQRLSNRIKKGIAYHLKSQHRVNAYDTSRAQLKSVFQLIQRKRPKYIIGYTSFLVALSEYILSAGLKALQIEDVIITSESYDNGSLRLIEEAFPAASIITEYGMAELGVIAYGPAKEGLTFDTWYGFTEVVQGEIIFSSLQQMDFPYFRYATGDGCDTPLLRKTGQLISASRIEGRLQEIAEVKSIKGVIKKISVIQIIHCVKSLPEVSQVQVIQLDSETLEIRVSLTQGADATKAERSLFEMLFNEYQVAAPNVELTFNRQFEKSIAGKLSTYVS